jgi:hypothetical protein
MAAQKEIQRLGLAAASEVEPQEVTMSILGDIVSRIFRRSASPASAAPAGTPSPQSKPASPQAAPPATPGSQVDVAAVMDKLAAQSKEKLDWRKSIVDLMKLLKLDSSLGARKVLAKELHYTGNMNDSASMNLWLHKASHDQACGKRRKGSERAKELGKFPPSLFMSPYGTVQ